MPRIKSPYTLSKGFPRMSWNKYNVYNLDKQFPQKQFRPVRNLLQLRLVAKRITRKYHGQGLSERVFKKQLYSPQINVVAGGTPGGKLEIWGGLFQGVERRLDNVIFRSLFASSIQQARQMVVHGHVEVNGKIEHRPGLLLRPGDIYHANPQMVKRYISNLFHANQEHLQAPRRAKMMELRELFLQKKGKKLEQVLPERLPDAHRFEYDPYIPIEIQGQHPLIKLLDEEAKREEMEFQRNDAFRPKPFMAPNVYLPAYLEVSYRSCTGCFVTMPQVKKDGKTEIPSPYQPWVHEQAGMYYTRFAKKALKGGYRGYKLFWSKNKRRT